jgi:hypothetical protein
MACSIRLEQTKIMFYCGQRKILMADRTDPRYIFLPPGVTPEEHRQGLQLNLPVAAEEADPLRGTVSHPWMELQKPKYTPGYYTPDIPTAAVGEVDPQRGELPTIWGMPPLGLAVERGVEIENPFFLPPGVTPEEHRQGLTSSEADQRGLGQAVAENIGGGLNAVLGEITGGAYQHVNALIWGLGNMLFGRDHTFSTGYYESLFGQEALQETLNPMVRSGLQGAGLAIATALTQGRNLPGYFATSLPRAVSARSSGALPGVFGNIVATGIPRAVGTGATLGLGGGLVHGFATAWPGSTFDERARNAAREGFFGGVLGGAVPPFFYGAGSLGQRIAGLFSRRRNPNITELYDNLESSKTWLDRADLDDMTENNINLHAPAVPAGSRHSYEAIDVAAQYQRAASKRVYSLLDSRYRMPTSEVSTRLASMQYTNPMLITHSKVQKYLDAVESEIAGIDSIPLSRMEEWRQQISLSMRTQGMDPNELIGLQRLRDLIDDAVLDSTARYRVARDMWTNTMRLNTLEDLAWRASNNATLSYEKAFKKEIRNFVTGRGGDRRLTGWSRFTEEQQDALRDVSLSSSPIEGLHNLMNRLFPNETIRSLSAISGVVTGQPLLLIPTGVQVARNTWDARSTYQALDALMGTFPGSRVTPYTPPQFGFNPATRTILPATAAEHMINYYTGGGF